MLLDLVAVVAMLSLAVGSRTLSFGTVVEVLLDVFWQVLPFMLVGLLPAAMSAPALDLLQLGADVACSLGANSWPQKASHSEKQRVEPSTLGIVGAIFESRSQSFSLSPALVPMCGRARGR